MMPRSEAASSYDVPEADRDEKTSAPAETYYPPPELPPDQTPFISADTMEQLLMASRRTAKRLTRYKAENPSGFNKLMQRIAYRTGTAQYRLKEKPPGRGRPHGRSESELAKFIVGELKAHGLPSGLYRPRTGNTSEDGFVEAVLRVCFMAAFGKAPKHFDHYDPQLTHQARQNGHLPKYFSRTAF
ncbi:hypothetical protein K6W36_01660 [Acetobacter senegalensis]|uniref:hypothetical protein n=1 Tax=Acetobacter senegalensis TaxID=446692 RepID=UPI001EDB317F|nr:hypothetical protein [Acetobacter senegalensis]MCG4259296.1 hypothetical protein [Acetobacter senegalensis]